MAGLSYDVGCDRKDLKALEDAIASAVRTFGYEGSFDRHYDDEAEQDEGEQAGTDEDIFFVLAEAVETVIAGGKTPEEVEDYIRQLLDDKRKEIGGQNLSQD